MAANSSREEVWRGRMTLAARRFNAWWEGYAFDGALEHADIASRRRGLMTPPEFEIPQLIWGAGRNEPGDAAWTMRQARSLGLALKARVMIFGAGGGAPLKDVRAGARWTAAGLTRQPVHTRGLDLKTYDEASAQPKHAAAEGALAFFELHRDADPAAFARMTAGFLRPGAPTAFVDFAVSKPGARLKSSFTAIAPGAPRTAADYVRALKESGFAAGDVIDETRAYLPLIARGWSGWRRAYDAACGRPDIAARAEAMRFLGDYANLWAERFDALKSGALQVVRLPARMIA